MVLFVRVCCIMHYVWICTNCRKEGLKEMSHKHLHSIHVNHYKHTADHATEVMPVSYTHLDVYKRQSLCIPIYQRRRQRR